MVGQILAIFFEQKSDFKHTLDLLEIIIMLTQLLPSDVEPIHKDSLTGKETTLSCKITGLTTATTVLWKQGDTTLSGSTPGSLVGETQTSTLTVSNPTDDEVYTCVVTSGLFAESASSGTDVKLDVYCE